MASWIASWSGVNEKSIVSISEQRYAPLSQLAISASE
jgi:hypothetical protein